MITIKKTLKDPPNTNKQTKIVIHRNNDKKNGYRLTEIIVAIRYWNNISKYWGEGWWQANTPPLTQEKNCKLKFLYLVNLFFKNEDKDFFRY